MIEARREVLGAQPEDLEDSMAGLETLVQGTPAAAADPSLRAAFQTPPGPAGWPSCAAASPRRTRWVGCSTSSLAWSTVSSLNTIPVVTECTGRLNTTILTPPPTLWRNYTALTIPQAPGSSSSLTTPERPGAVQEVPWDQGDLVAERLEPSYLLRSKPW